MFTDPLASTGEVGKLIWATTATITDKSEKWYFQPPGCAAVSKVDPGQPEPFVAASLITCDVVPAGPAPGPCLHSPHCGPCSPTVGV